jgi:maleylacetate reductase
MTLQHKKSHLFCGTYGLSHADVHAVILPHAVAYNREAAPEAMRAVAEVLGVTDPVRGLHDLAVRIGAPISLKSIGMPEDQLDNAARIVIEHPYPNPRPVDYAGIRQLLQDAFL